jgi:hypothetical protein
VRRSRAGRSNSGEPFRPRGGDLRRAKAWDGFSRGRGDTGTYSGELDWAKLAGHRASSGRSSGTGVSPRGGARGGLERSPASWMAGNVGTGLRRRLGGVGRARERAKLREMR